MRVAATVAGVCLIRDAVDIASLLCGHYLRIGFSHIAFIDDASTDGTFELLTEMARHEPRVSVRRIVSDGFTQAAHISDESNALIARGFEIVIPFDADEFWVVDAPALEAKYQHASDVTFYGTWTNFVQNRSANYPRPFGLFQIKYSAPSLADADRIRVTDFKRALVCMEAVRKYGIKSRQTVRFGTGQHNVYTDEAISEEATHFDVYHVPLRYKSELTKRGLNYEPRRAPVRTGPAKGWQGPFHRDVELVSANRTDEVSGSQQRRQARFSRRLWQAPPAHT